MLKYAALLFNTIALLIYQFFFADGITVTQNIPSSAKPETEFTVELTINKGTIGGFAKLQQDLPEGFTAVQDDNNGASFTFTNQAVKFIWMSLPTDKEFKIKYKVKVAAGLSGDKVIAGKFSYVSDNVKQSVEIAPSTITIGDGKSQPIATTTPTTTTTTTTTEPTTTAATTPTTTTTTTTTTEPTTTVATTTPTTTTTEPTTTTGTQEPSSITCVRTVPSNVNGNFTVEIIVNKGNVTGFAKLLETLPAGFTASAGESQGGSFSFADQKVKFVWVSMPSATEFKISYKVAVASSASGNQNIDGVFSYIENDETKKYVLPTSTTMIGGGSMATTTTSTTPTTTTTEPTTTTTAATTTTTTPTTTTDNNAKSLAATTIPSPQGIVNYSTQIAALHNAVNADVLATRYNINAKVNTEMADGFTKYTTGSYTDYKTARDAREDVKNKGVVGPFVTAYNSGKRITVQEALMITSQKWFR
jgi:cell division septation protein DedD